MIDRKEVLKVAKELGEFEKSASDLVLPSLPVSVIPGKVLKSMSERLIKAAGK